MTDIILVINAGSSSIKFSLFKAGAGSLEPSLRGQVESLFTQPHFIAKDTTGQVVSEKNWDAGTQLGHGGGIDHLVDFLRGEFQGMRLVGVGHRVVHGGMDYTGPVRIDSDVVQRLERFLPLAPLHQPHNLAPIRELLERQPQLPQVACFDTSFHRSNPEVSQRYGLPEELFAEGVRRYGFHGLSYEYIASVLPDVDATAARGRTIVLHLGNGASLCAMNACRSQANTMGFTGVEGLPMGTRSGTLDPGVMLYLMDQKKMDARAIEKLIYHQSGLLGVSGISSDMRTLLASDDPRARLAVDLYIYRIGREIGSLAAALGGLDALVFTGGIGENSADIRARVMAGAKWLGAALDTSANDAGESRISAADSRVSAWRVSTNEELMIARHTLALLDT
jgi:acetate kinase